MDGAYNSFRSVSLTVNQPNTFPVESIIVINTMYLFFMKND